MPWPLDLAAIDLAEANPAESRERELGATLVFRALEPITEQPSAPLLRAASEAVEPAWWALEPKPTGGVPNRSSDQRLTLRMKHLFFWNLPALCGSLLPMESLRCATDLLVNPGDGRPLRFAIILLLENEPYGALPNLERPPCLPKKTILSRKEPSGKPGAIIMLLDLALRCQASTGISWSHERPSRRVGAAASVAALRQPTRWGSPDWSSLPSRV